MASSPRPFACTSVILGYFAMTLIWPATFPGTAFSSVRKPIAAIMAMTLSVIWRRLPSRPPEVGLPGPGLQGQAGQSPERVALHGRSNWAAFFASATPTWHGGRKPQSSACWPRAAPPPTSPSCSGSTGRRSFETSPALDRCHETALVPSWQPYRTKCYGAGMTPESCEMSRISVSF